MSDDKLICQHCMATFEDTEAGREGFEEHDCHPSEAGERIEVSPSVGAAAMGLSQAGHLTERQAFAYVLREVEAVPRQEAADRMDISASTLDDRLGEARRKVEQARETLRLVDDLEGDR